MKTDIEEDLFENGLQKEEAEEEDDGEDFSAENGFLKGYNEDVDDPYEEKVAEEESEY